ncbi:MAG: PAS domain S-box protein [Gammaproteobacteria bacterium]|nr:PAS domain S-box protein [Gammaproteobacteria bacterium]MBU1602439.1 PAS domain S-box protein [Gammaproteobacteria bacterium]MBU2433244.1 PAS domain S-box protein [Gammaproteobacteria bacterium]MBU2451160.1 PAS domain S-box protein [Gammaproteobacteria bacterium]
MANSENPGTPGKRRGHSVGKLWLGTLLVNLFVFGIVGLIIERNHQREVAQAVSLTENYAKILEEALIGFISKIDLTLHTVGAEVERQLANGGIDDKMLDALVARQDALIPEALGLRVVDAQGTIRNAVNAVQVPQVSIADRPQFIRLRDDPLAGLVFSKPVVGRAAGKWLITLGRRVNYPDGRFAGDVHVAVAVDHFISMFAKLDLGNNGNIGLWDKTTLLARYARDDTHGATVGNMTPSSNLRGLLDSGLRAANYHAPSGVDGISRGYHFRQIGNYPLYLVVGLADDDYLRNWWRDTLGILALAGLFSLATLVSATLIGRSLRRQEVDEAALARQAADYTSRLEASNSAAEAAWQQSELILASAAEGICGVDLAGKVTFVNPAARRMFGWADNEGVGKDLHAETHHHQADGSVSKESDCPVYQTLRDGQRRHVEDSLYWRRDGSSFAVEFTVSPIERDGQISGAVNVFRDISERKRIEAELERHRRNLEELVQQRTSELIQTEARASHILDSSADGLYGIDRAGIITFMNPAGCAILGYTPEQVVGRLAHTLFHHSKADNSPYPSAECPSYKSLRQGDKIRVDDEVYWHADGHPVPVMYATHPMLQNGEITGAVTSFVDVSVQRAAMQAREVALAAAENLARVRREFLANMSHEIRTPLNGVLGFAEIGARNYLNSDKARDAFTKIQSSGQRLLGVINDVLDFSKLDAGKLNIEQTEVVIEHVVASTLELVRDRAGAKGLALQVDLAPDLPRTCLSDPLRMGQVLLNVLTNAVKFTEAGSIALSLSCRDGMLVFRVADSGIGMDAEQLDLLFNPFQQADASSTRKFGGSGLGLAISKRILDLMDGEIRVDSQPGVGTCVEFRLPCVTSPSAVEPSAAPQDAGAAGGKPLAGLSILVADDESINRLILEEILVEYGARVVSVGDGRAAVERVLGDGPGAFDVVLMDIQMPGMDGYEAARRILEAAPQLPVIAQTAHAFREELDRCLAAGMVAHVTKPIDADALIRVIRQNLAVGVRG